MQLPATMMENRQRLRPWLEARINSGKIDGLRWLNEEKTMFRIPWKHGGKQDWTPHDSNVFKDWAVHTGKFREGIDEPDYATWKTRLRCAFNKAQDIQEMKDKTDLDGASPFRVYELLPKRACSRIVGRATPEDESTYSPDAASPHGDYDMGHGASSQIVPRVVTDMQSMSDESLEQMGSLSSDLKGIHSFDLVGKNDAGLADIKVESEGMQYMDIGASDNVAVDPQSYPTNTVTGYPTMVLGEGGHAQLPNHGQSQDQRFTDQLNIGSIPSFSSIPMVSLPSDFERNFLSGMVAQQTVQGHEMLLTIQYGNNGVLPELTLDQPQGARLKYTSSADKSWLPHVSNQVPDPSNLQNVYFPPCTEMVPTGKREDITNELLDTLVKGFDLQCVDGDVYATRHCKCAVYFTTSFTSGRAVKLDRQVPTKIFDYHNHFLPALQSYVHSRHNGCESPLLPSASIQLGLGQKWPFGTTLNDVLISATVCSLKAKKDLSEVVGNGNNGGHDDDSLHISKSDEFDQFQAAPYPNDSQTHQQQQENGMMM